jgi:hypothetical protein
MMPGTPSLRDESDALVIDAEEVEEASEDVAFGSRFQLKRLAET